MAIKLLVLDVDGTMTDGGLYLDSTGNETKKFTVKDGAGLVLARTAGIKIMILTGRDSVPVQRRADELRLDYCVQGCHDKAAYLAQFIREQELSSAEVAYVGDDWNDLAAMALCGFVACPANAAPEVKASANLITAEKGGEGAVRAAVIAILKADGRYADALQRAYGVSL